jgi:hypothetical protein
MIVAGVAESVARRHAYALPRNPGIESAADHFTFQLVHMQGLECEECEPYMDNSRCHQAHNGCRRIESEIDRYLDCAGASAVHHRHACHPNI